MSQVRPQWFVRMEPLAKPALAAVANGDIRIVPDRFEKVYNRWLENIRVRLLSSPRRLRSAKCNWQHLDGAAMF